MIFGKANAFRISLTSKEIKICDTREVELFNRRYARRSLIESSLSDSSKYETTHPLPQNIPELWFQEVHELSSGRLDLSKKFPDAITSWTLRGYSINQQYGIAVAQPQEIEFFQDFFIKVVKPIVVKPAETVNVNVIVYNFVSTPAEVALTLRNNYNEFEFIEGSQAVMELNKTINTQVEAGGVAQVVFCIRPKVEGKVLLTIKATSNNRSDEVEDSMYVGQSTQKEIIITRYDSRTVIVNMNDVDFYNYEMAFEVKNAVEESVSFEATVSNINLHASWENMESLMLVYFGKKQEFICNNLFL